MGDWGARASITFDRNLVSAELDAFCGVSGAAVVVGLTAPLGVRTELVTVSSGGFTLT